MKEVDEYYILKFVGYLGKTDISLKTKKCKIKYVVFDRHKVAPPLLDHSRKPKVKLGVQFTCLR